MSLEPSTTLGPYEVVAEIGKGGMGEVYRARDTKLDRRAQLVTTTVVRENVKVAAAPSAHQPIIRYAPHSNGTADYQAVAGELLRTLR